MPGLKEGWEEYVERKFKELFVMSKEIAAAEKAGGGGVGLPPLVQRMLGARFVPEQLRRRLERVLQQRTLMEGARWGVGWGEGDSGAGLWRGAM